MSECLDDKLLEEKKSFIDFILKNKIFKKEVESFNVNYEKLFNYDISIYDIFKEISAYAEWETQSELFNIANKKFPNLYQEYLKNIKFDFSNMKPPKDWDSHDSDPHHF